jgi:hypothetical protein
LIDKDLEKEVPISDARWSSLVARRAHNPKVVGSNPALATNFEMFKKKEFIGLNA